MENQFYVGQEVVAIKDHPEGRFKKGQEFKIQGIRQSCCTIQVNIGIKYDFKNYNGYSICSKCMSQTKSDGYSWYNQMSFAPKQHLSNTTYNEVMEWIKKGNEISILN